MDANLTGLFLFNFESTSCKNHSDTNLVQIHYAVIEILSFSCSALFLVTAAILESQTAKKYNGFIQETFWHKDGSILTSGSEDSVILVFMLFLVTVPGGHLG